MDGNASDDHETAGMDRYSRQVLFQPIGEAGQRRLLGSRATLIGCGAIGSMQADLLVRAGLGFLRICDRDFLEENNLQRQALFDENDVAEQIPKAEAAKRRLASVNSRVRTEAVVAHVDHTNIERLVAGADVILDGTDNLETRFLINDASVKLGIPWVYGAVISSTGLVMPIVPGRTPCLRCVFESAPPPGTTPTCDTAGVIGPVVGVVASLQAAEAMKILTGNLDDVRSELLSVDVWEGRYQPMDVAGAKESGDCRCCKRRDFEYLAGDQASTTTTLCGRDAVQISPQSPARGEGAGFEEIAARLAGVTEVTRNRFLTKFAVEGLEFTVFPDGRTVIKGTSDTEAARAAYARYVGH